MGLAMSCCGEGLGRLLRRKATSSESVCAKISVDYVTLNDNSPQARSQADSSPTPRRSLTQEYAIENDQVGEGGFGCVKKVKDKKTGAELVMKVMPKSCYPEVSIFRNEIELQAKCNHPHIARLLEVFETEEEVYIVMESCDGGEVLDLVIQADGHIGEVAAWHIFQQLIGTLVYLHSKVLIAHRDLKPENFLIKEKGVPLGEATMKLIDFGFAQTFEPGERSLKTKCGTPYYMCPEILSGNYNEKCDIWSCGVILYLLLGGEFPFDGESAMDILQKAKTGYMSFAEEAWGSVDPSAQFLIRSMCALDSEQRPSAMEVQDLAWMKRTREQVEKTQAPSPKKSVDAVVSSLKRYQKMNKFKRVALGAMGHVFEDKDIAKLRNTFEALDLGGDGVISVAELQKALHEAGISTDNVSELTAGLARDGSISYSDFLAANVRRENYTKESYCWEAFRILDKDGSGSIDLHEFKEVMKKNSMGSGNAYSSLEAEQLFKQADLKGTGSVDFEEFMELMKDTTAEGSAFCPSARPSLAPTEAATLKD